MDGLSLEIGNRLKALRKRRGLTQKELAARVSSGIDYTYIGKIERGRQLPSLKVMQKLSESLSVPLSYFFAEDSETVVYVKSPAEFGESLQNGRAGVLFSALMHLNESDVALVIEIIRMMAKHRSGDSRLGREILSRQGLGSEEK